ncbi:MAG: circularly permuted type 2 ATP-grasp protein [Alphaproteobacteria bacterium]|nr:circularly permuted type 2 ATP-grasp protein [Alphaproteobacteria bacterium]
MGLAKQDEPSSRLAAARVATWTAGYAPLPGIPDELTDRGGKIRPAWKRFLPLMAAMDEEEMRARFAAADRHIREAGVSFRVYGDESERVWPLSHLPLLLEEGEWQEITAGIVQRAGLLEIILKDLYGKADLVTSGALPAAVVTGSREFLRPMVGLNPPGGRYLHIYAADLGRGPDGRWWILDDRAQAPSGAGYALENRLVQSRAFPAVYNSMNVQRLAPFFSAFRAGLAQTAKRSEPRICLLTPGIYSETYFEQAHLARYLGFDLVEGDDLVASADRAHLRTIAGPKRADIILRRVDSDFIDPLELNSTSHLGAAGLLETMRAGGVVVANMPGSGLIEMRALLSFMPALAEKLLGEPLRLPNTATWWCGQTKERQKVEAELDALAIAPAFTGGPHILPAELDAPAKARLRRQFKDRPMDFVAQEVVRLSTTPIWADGRLSPKPFVLRVYAAATAQGWTVMPGGFARISEKADARAISMGAGVRSADVWVLSSKPVERVSLLTSGEHTRVRRLTGPLPSRAADNLFWLGRYLERLEGTLRLVRTACASVMESDGPRHGEGATLEHLHHLLITWEAAPRALLEATAPEVVAAVMVNREAMGSVYNLVAAARRTASGMRERLSPDAWRVLGDIAQLTSRDDDAVRMTETEALARADRGLQALAAFSGLAQENMNRAAGWRFLDIGRRLERAIHCCQYMQIFAREDAGLDDLDVLLDLIDSQIIYRSRYMGGLALAPVRDLVLLDPFNPRSAAFQIRQLKEHMEALPRLHEDGVLEEPQRVVIRLAAAVETVDGIAIGTEGAKEIEAEILHLSDAIAERFFPHRAPAKRPYRIDGSA